MTIFMNNDSNIYRSKQPVQAPNQEQVVVDRISEFVKEQQKVNRHLTRSYNALNQLYNRQQNTQEYILNQIKSLENRHQSHDQFRHQTLMRLSSYDQKQTKVEDWMKQEEFAKEQLIKELKSIHKSNQNIIDELTKQDDTSDELLLQLNEMMDVQHKISEQISNHELKQQEMAKKIENQEALIEKMHQQLTNFRSIIYERSHHLAEKIEDQYHMTSNYIQHLMNGKEHPMTFMVTKKKEDE
ncbi:hypothetical protein [Piscibacillus salipiscarius]|uniref:t-SNARE coiled-coil homology domain-containing protein n=1 Tax=Piscibacillus salipiscarius TaxID=299480 RepID=A0ABW5QA03_9BACI|nr:hypothetical protein [Piscibacillus salipiscarius]